MSVVALGDTKRMLFAIFCCALLMFLTAPVSAAQEADPSNAPTIGKSALLVGSTTGCGVLITITGTSGHLVATIAGGGTASGNPYDGEEDELGGVQNNPSVSISAIILSAARMNLRLQTTCSPSTATGLATTPPRTTATTRIASEGILRCCRIPVL
jgi:hypothetical protein